MLSDKKTSSLLKAVAVSENPRSDILITKLRLSRKQYYIRLEKLIHGGLVTRISGKYSLTSFGKVIYDIEAEIIDSAIKDYRSLKSIDS